MKKQSFINCIDNTRQRIVFHITKIKKYKEGVPWVKAMTIQERQTLGHNINSLSTEQLIGIYDIVKGCINGQTETLEFDLKELPDHKCRQLEDYVN